MYVQVHLVHICGPIVKTSTPLFYRTPVCFIGQPVYLYVLKYRRESLGGRIPDL